MLTSFWVSVLAGTVLGFLSGLGVGGGSLLMLWLTLVVGMDQGQARLMNLMFFLPCAMLASLFRFKKAKPQLRLSLYAMGAALLGAVIGNILNGQMELTLLRKAFGVLFLICGIREVRYRERKFR